MSDVQVREVVTVDRPISAPPEPRWRQIIREVCAEYRVHPGDVIRRGRGPARFIRPRMEVARRLFRFTETSSNLFLPPAGEKAQWMELASVGLGNGAGEDALDKVMNGDSVGVVRLFDMPAEAERILKSVEGGGEGLAKEERLIQLVRGGEWRSDRRTGDLWVGHAIAKAFDLDLDSEDDVSRAKLVLKNFLKTGRLEEYQKADSKRMTRTFIRVSDHISVNENSEREI